MMEKYDGVRVYWDGKALISKEINIPADMLNCELPFIPFEGELWYHTEFHYILIQYRMGYNKPKSEYTKFLKDPQRDWRNASIMVFDAPQDMDKPYNERIKTLQQGYYNTNFHLYFIGIPDQHPILRVISPIECTNKNHVASFFKEICVDRPEDKRAEGLVLRKPTWYFGKNGFLKKEVSQPYKCLFNSAIAF
jgi:hypothetical protein